MHIGGCLVELINRRGWRRKRGGLVVSSRVEDGWMEKKGRHGTRLESKEMRGRQRWVLRLTIRWMWQGGRHGTGREEEDTCSADDVWGWLVLFMILFLQRWRRSVSIQAGRRYNDKMKYRFGGSLSRRAAWMTGAPQQLIVSLVTKVEAWRFANDSISASILSDLRRVRTFSVSVGGEQKTVRKIPQLKRTQVHKNCAVSRRRRCF